MILSAAQAYFAPYPGYFEKIRRSDVFVVLDAVQFPRGTTWMTRNRFKNDQGTLWMTLPVHKKGRGLQRIDRVRLYSENRWQAKHLASLKSAYSRSPWFTGHLGFVTTLFDGRYDRLIDLNLAVITYLTAQLGITTRLVRQLELETQEKGTRLLIELCLKLGADTFLAQRPAAKYLDRAMFKQAGLQVRYFQSSSRTYPQLWGSFIPNLSAFDLIFNCGPRAAKILQP